MSEKLLLQITDCRVQNAKSRIKPLPLCPPLLGKERRRLGIG
jgi:hypothetical protein